ncbi:MAG: type II toxin-antitoxin system HigB family toxin [Chitinophagaceae bacterium]|nr:type II toxin-antitoxin system HigB family toxin [Chitinophagaceae bacterium]
MENAHRYAGYISRYRFIRGSNRAVFDIGGNKYRMIAKYAFGDRHVHLFICWIGTHAAYDKLCNAGEQYNISNY